MTSSDSDTSRFAPEDLSGPTIDRRTTLKLLGAAGMAGLAGCLGGDGGSGGDGNGSGGGGSGGTGGRLRAGWFTGSIDVLDPPYISVGQYFQVAANVFSGLVTLKKDLTIRGDLARDWTVENGGATIRFDLRKGVTFHDGSEFTAADVKYTIERTISEEAPAASKLSTLKPVDEDGVVVDGDYAVTLNFEEPMAPALVYLTRGPGRAATIVSKTAIEEMGAEAYRTEPVGTGPFQVREHQVGSKLVLDAFDDYFETDEDGNALPYLDGIDVKPIPEAATLVNALRSGEIDFANLVPLQNLDQVEGASGVTASVSPGVNWYGFAMNETKEVFSSRKGRLGIAKLIDNEQFVETAYFGNALPDTGPINKATEWAWRDEKPSIQDHDPDAGKQLVEEAGIAGASFSILTAQGDTRAAKAMRQQLNAAGFDVEIEQVTSSTYWERYEKLDYDTTISGSVGDPDPDQSLYNFYRLPDDGGVWNWVNFEDERVHELLAEQRRELDRKKRTEILHELEDRLIEQVPHAYLMHQNDIAAHTDRVKGFSHIPFMRNFHTVRLDG
ncbi:ABC transporter substrate-binding protein [Halomarina halobia]|uniref:ABC transporter substrate-binding protein n=1 Tax=Halomarina halobia TaxID=3033386 RepID=A0ABD6A4Q8_9EURY|nr:ABC transporter substrate-binding protein [Halomarina sp. PSR21]